MTCIVALVDHGSVHMAGDLMGSNGFTGRVYEKSKVFINDGFIFGYTTSFRMGQLLEYSWNAPPRTERTDDDEYLYRDVVNSFMKLFKDNHYGHKKEHEMETGEFLFGWKGRLFLHQENHSILEIDNFTSIGSGSYHAEAALATLVEYTDWKMDHEFLLSSAISVASGFVTSVSSKYSYLELKHDE